MAISIRKYVDITSGIGAGVVVKLRELILRVFTSNPLLPTLSIKEFTSSADVGEYFGLASEEYLRSLFYFGWVSKSTTRPSKISFARYASADTLPQIFGFVAPQSVAAWTGISNGSFVLTIGATSNTMSGLDFTGATTLAGVAAIIQTAIRTKTGSMWTAATVTYDATRGSFNFNGGIAGPATIAATAPGTGTNILVNGLLGWTVSGIFSNGIAAQTPVEAVNDSAATSSNFGTYLFQPALTLEQVTDLSVWNDAQNVAYMFLAHIAGVDASTYFTALKNYSGVALTEETVSGQYPEMVPGLIAAATDYTRPNSSQNYMYQQFALTPSATDDDMSDTLDANRINYYGRTQTAGQQIDLYQRGVLMGLATAPLDMNVYVNEMWLKDAAASACMEMLLNLGRVSANKNGRAQVIQFLQPVITQALNNGVISVGKAFEQVQKAYITDITGSDTAWHQVQGIGYWLDCRIEPYATVDGRTEYKAVYLLIYAKDDAIRKVEGTHTLI